LYKTLKRYDESETYYKIALSLDSNANIVYYNLACLYATMGDTKKSLKSLETDLIKGYINFDLIGSDEDLNNIRKLEEFDVLIKKYKK
jgi:tetratricopeptide (TPR) repeat protein